jgi:hypothetical protein
VPNSTLQPTPTRATKVAVCYSFACGLARLSVRPLDGRRKEIADHNNAWLRRLAVVAVTLASSVLTV